MKMHKRLVMSADFEKIIRQMMTPSPKLRPDVDTLLRWPRIQVELENRRKIAPIKYLVMHEAIFFSLSVRGIFYIWYPFTENMLQKIEKFHMAKHLQIQGLRCEFSNFRPIHDIVCYGISQPKSNSSR